MSKQAIVKIDEDNHVVKLSVGDVEINLEDAPHILIAGMNNSGKTTLIHEMITDLMGKYKSDELNFMIADFAGTNYQTFNESPFLKDGHIISELKEFVNKLDEIVGEIENRFEILNEYNLKNIDLVYEDNNVCSLPRIIVFVDEFTGILNSNISIKRQFLRDVQIIGAKGRAVGIHMIFSTALEKGLNNEILMANFPCRIVFNVPNKKFSYLVMGNSDAVDLKEKEMIIIGPMCSKAIKSKFYS